MLESVEPSSVEDLVVVPLSPTALNVSWSSPECPYGVISSYIVYYRQSDTPQTEDISSEGYTRISVQVDSDSNITTKRYHAIDITGLTPFTYYAVHVQAVVTPTLRPGQDDIPGAITEEVVERTYSTVDPDVPTVLPTVTPINSPTSREVTYLIPNPQLIDTGRVM